MVRKQVMSDRELNQKLMESMNLTDTEARKAFEQMMNEKYESIRQEVRQEVYEQMSKQVKQDKEHLIESMNQITNKVINEEKAKIASIRKNMIKEKLSLEEARKDIRNQIMDKTALLKEEFQKKYETAVAKNQQAYDNKLKSYMDKATKFINESVKSELSNYAKDKKTVNEALEKFGQFISSQVVQKNKEIRDEIKSMDVLKVRLVKESQEKAVADKRKLVAEMADKLGTFINKAVKHEITTFREDMLEARKKSFGSRLFEAFAQEFAIKFFNEDKVAKGLMESVKGTQNRLKQANKVLAEQKSKLDNEIKMLKESNDKLIREKIITESTSHLSNDRKKMIDTLIKDVPTNRLKESIDNFLPSVIGKNVNNSINTVKSRMLSENKSMRVVSGSTNKKQETINKMANELDDELSAEIDSIVKRAKF